MLHYVSMHVGRYFVGLKSVKNHFAQIQALNLLDLQYRAVNDCEDFTIVIVEIMVFTIMTTIMIVDWLNI